MKFNPLEAIRATLGTDREVAARAAFVEPAPVIESLVGRNQPTALAAAVEQQNTRTQLASLAEIHLIRNKVKNKAEEVRSLGNMMEQVARVDGAASVAPHQNRLNRLQRELADLLVVHDTLLRDSGRAMDSSVREVADAILSAKTAERVVDLKLPSGETALEARINQLLTDQAPLRRPVLDLEAKPTGQILADRLRGTDSPQSTVDRYTSLLDGATERRSSVPTSDQAARTGTTLPSSSQATRTGTTLPDTSGVGKRINVPSTGDLRAKGSSLPTSTGRTNRATSFLERDLSSEASEGEETTDVAMQQRLKQLRDNPDAAPGFQGVSFDVGDDNSGPFKIQI